MEKSRIKIISGSLRGRYLEVPSKGMEARPTMSKVREALFSMLNSGRFWGLIEGATVLDLCSGTGGLAFEALSRGAIAVCCVDEDPLMIEALRRNGERLGVREAMTLVLGDIRRLPRASSPVDVVFLDPPYQKGLVPLALESAQRQGWVDLDTVVVVEHALTETIAPPQGWEVAVHRRYGRSGVTVLCAVHDGAKDDEHDDAATED